MFDASDESVDGTFARLVVTGLNELVSGGMHVVSVDPSFVKLSRGDLDVRVYWGRRSNEVGAEVCVDGECYSLSELIRLTDPCLAAAYRNPTATSAEQLGHAVSQVTQLLVGIGVPAPDDVKEMVAALQSQRANWSKELALDSLVRLTRPAADEAFRRQEYARAADLYGKILGLLSKAEIRKYEYAKAHSSSSGSDASN